MKIGSLVQCIDASGIHLPSGHKKPVEGKTYTVTGFWDGSRGIGIFVEECEDQIILDHKDGTKTIMPPPFKASRFREILPPVSISVEELIHDHA